MPKTVTLPDDLAEIVDAYVKQGRFTSADAVVGTAVARMADDLPLEGDVVPYNTPEEIAVLRRLVEEGIASGDPQPLDLDWVKRESRRRRAARAG
jgi:putative addiction module CopG family antidote